MVQSYVVRGAIDTGDCTWMFISILMNPNDVGVGVEVGNSGPAAVVAADAYPFSCLKVSVLKCDLFDVDPTLLLFPLFCCCCCSQATAFLLFATGRDSPRSFPRLATPTPHVNCVLYPEHVLPRSMHWVQYGRLRSQVDCASWQAKQSSTAPVVGARRLRFRGEAGESLDFGAIAATEAETSAAMIAACEEFGERNSDVARS